MTDVLTTTGAYDALFTTFQALICPGDEVWHEFVNDNYVIIQIDLIELT